MSIRNEVSNVLNRYALAYDMNDLDDMGSVFTEDATMSMRIKGQDLIGPFEGREQIIKLMTDSSGDQTDQRRHVINNLVIRSQSEDEVHAQSYLVLLSVENGQIQVLSSGVFTDLLRRTSSAGWQITQRHLDLDLPY